MGEKRVFVHEKGRISKISLISERSALLFPQELAMALQLCPVVELAAENTSSGESAYLFLSSGKVNEKMIMELSVLLDMPIEIEIVPQDLWLSAYETCYWKEWQRENDSFQLLALKPPASFDELALAEKNGSSEYQPFPDLDHDKPVVDLCFDDALLLNDDGWKPVVLDPASMYTLNQQDLDPGKEAEVGDLGLKESPQKIQLLTPRDTNSENDIIDRAEVPQYSEEQLKQEKIDNLIKALSSQDRQQAASAEKELMLLGEEVSLPLRIAFPGVIKNDPIKCSSLIFQTSELSSLVALLEKRGDSSLNIVAPYLRAEDPVKKYAAMLLYMKFLRFEHIELLKPFLLSPHPQLFQLCTYIFRLFTRYPQFQEQLKVCHQNLLSSNQNEKNQAAAMIGCFTDLSAIPLLIARLNDPDQQFSDLCHRSLKHICLQNLSKSPQLWLQWWDGARKQSRMQWLMDALRSEIVEFRKIAALDLLFVANQDFGYKPAASVEERGQALQRIQSWWQKLLNNAH